MTATNVPARDFRLSDIPDLMTESPLTYCTKDDLNRWMKRYPTKFDALMNARLFLYELVRDFGSINASHFIWSEFSSAFVTELEWALGFDLCIKHERPFNPLLDEEKTNHEWIESEETTNILATTNILGRPYHEALESLIERVRIDVK